MIVEGQAHGQSHASITEINTPMCPLMLLLLGPMHMFSPGACPVDAAAADLDGDDPPPPAPPANGNFTSDEGSTGVEVSANGDSAPIPSCGDGPQHHPALAGQPGHGAGPSDTHADNQIAEPQQDAAAVAGPSLPIKRSRSAELNLQQASAHVGPAQNDPSSQPGKRRRTQQVHHPDHPVKAEGGHLRQSVRHQASADAAIRATGQTPEQQRIASEAAGRRDSPVEQTPPFPRQDPFQRQDQAHAESPTGPARPGGCTSLSDDGGVGNIPGQSGQQQRRLTRNTRAVQGSPGDNGGSDSSTDDDQDDDDAAAAAEAAHARNAESAQRRKAAQREREEAAAEAAAARRAEQAHRRSERHRKGKRKVTEVSDDEDSLREAEVVENNGPETARAEVGDSQADALEPHSRQRGQPGTRGAAAVQAGNAGSSNHETGRGASDASIQGTSPAGAADAAAHGNGQVNRHSLSGKPVERAKWACRSC